MFSPSFYPLSFLQPKKKPFKFNRRHEKRAGKSQGRLLPLSIFVVYTISKKNTMAF